MMIPLPTLFFFYRFLKAVLCTTSAMSIMLEANMLACMPVVTASKRSMIL